MTKERMSDISKTEKSALKRFIAGAVCPECKQLDKIVMYPAEQRVACISCDYEEVMTESSPPSTTTSNTGDTSVVRIVDPGDTELP